MNTWIIISAIITTVSAWSAFNERQKRKEESRKSSQRQANLKKKINNLMTQLSKLREYKNLSHKQREQINQLCQKIQNLKIENKDIKEQIKILEEQIKKFQTRKIS